MFPTFCLCHAMRNTGRYEVVLKVNEKGEVGKSVLCKDCSYGGVKMTLITTMEALNDTQTH